MYNFGTHTQGEKKTCFGAHLYSAGTQHGNFHQLSVTISRVTYFMVRAHTGTGVSQSQHRKNTGEVLGKNAVNGIFRFLAFTLTLIIMSYGVDLALKANSTSIYPEFTQCLRTAGNLNVNGSCWYSVLRLRPAKKGVKQFI